jgi:Leucine Rich repeat
VRFSMPLITVRCVVVLLACLAASPPSSASEKEIRSQFDSAFKEFPRTFRQATDKWLRSMGREPLDDDPAAFAREHRLVDQAFRQIAEQPEQWIARVRMVDETLPSEYWVFEFKFTDGAWRTHTGVKHLEQSELNLYKGDLFTTSMQPFVEAELEALQRPAKSSANAPAPSPRPVDKALLGRWTPTKLIGPGIARGEDDARGFAVYEFTASVTRVGNGVDSAEFEYRVEPDAKPARLEQHISLGGQDLVVRGVYRVTARQELEIVQNVRPGLPYPRAIRPEVSEDAAYMLLRRLTAAEEAAFLAGAVPEEVKPYVRGLQEKGVRFDTDRQGRIRTVMMSRGDVSDADLKDLGRLGSFTALSLLGASITAEGLTHVAGLKSLERLQLGMTQIDDEGIVKLASLENLQRLSLSFTAITNASVKTLGAMKHLRELDVSGTAITPEGLAELRRNLPGCTVVF